MSIKRSAIPAVPWTGPHTPKLPWKNQPEKPAWRCPECGTRYYDRKPQVCTKCRNEREV